MAEVFSRFRVPVFMADIKGDLKGISPAGTRTPRLTKVIVEREREREREREIDI
jgi:DNA helicase HerA-like ATPase